MHANDSSINESNTSIEEENANKEIDDNDATQIINNIKFEKDQKMCDEREDRKSLAIEMEFEKNEEKEERKEKCMGAIFHATQELLKS